MHLFPEIMGGGVALLDFDGDGDLDIYLVQGGQLDSTSSATAPGNVLLRNRGDATFDDVSAASGAADSGYGMGAAAADVDNDGDVDLLVSNVGENVLLINRGDGTFERRAIAGERSVWSASVAFFDHDRDGDLDIWVTNYVRWSREEDLRCSSASGAPDYCNPTSYSAPLSDQLLVNQGDGTFIDGSVDAGLGLALGNGLGVAVADYDDDGWPDVFVANDGTPNHLWLNQRDGTFLESARSAGVAVDGAARTKAGMGTAIADLDGDLDLEILVVNLTGQADTLFLNRDGLFLDRTAAFGLSSVSRPYTRFGVGLADLDHDTHVDLFQVNGRVTRDPASSEETFDEGHLLARGTVEGFRYLDDAVAAHRRTSRAAAIGDLDGDGDLDAVVVNRDAPAELLINQIGSSSGQWMMVRCLNARGSDAIGALAVISHGDRRQIRVVSPQVGYLTSGDPRLHFGLGAAESAQLTIRWPDGRWEDFGRRPTGRLVEARQGEGSAASGPPGAADPVAHDVP